MTPTDRVVDWTGGSLDDLVTMLSAPALAARIQVLVSEGASERVVGEVHMLAGGVAEAFAGALRDSSAMDHMRKLAPLRFRVEPCVPDPKTGGLFPPGPEEGLLTERPLAALMRYCEDHVMTCLLEVYRGGEQAMITYRRGEIVTTAVDGSDAPERLRDVMTWSEGRYRIMLPPLVLPAPIVISGGPRRPSARRDTLPFAPAFQDPRGRHGTVPGIPVDVFDVSPPERTTDVGMPAIAVPPAAAPTPPATAPAPPSRTPAPVVTPPSRTPPPVAPASTFRPPARPPAEAAATPLEHPRAREPRPSSPVATAPAAAASRTGPARSAPAASGPALAPSRREPEPRPAPAAAVPPAPAARTTLPERQAPRSRHTSPGYDTAASDDAAGPAPSTSTPPHPVLRRPTPRTIAVPSRSITDLPVTVHVILGLGLGLAIVGAYWVVQSFLPL